MLSSPDQSESGDAVMQDAAELSAPQIAAHTLPAKSPFTVASSNTSRQAKLTPAAAPSVDAAMGPAEPSAKLDVTTLSRLQKAGFQSREEAMTWLTAEGYAKNQEAFQALGVKDSSTVALLQPCQLKGLSGLKRVVHSKMILILDKMISDSDRLQMVFQQHRGWLEEHLGMEVAGKFTMPAAMTLRVPTCCTLQVHISLSRGCTQVVIMHAVDAEANMNFIAALPCR